VDPLATAKEVPGLATQLGVAISNGYGLAGFFAILFLAACAACGYVFVLLQRTQDKLAGRFDKVEKLMGEMTGVFQSLDKSVAGAAAERSQAPAVAPDLARKLENVERVADRIGSVLETLETLEAAKLDAAKRPPRRRT
jgi:hypothetical protein